MIQVNELRVGNYLKNFLGTFFEVNLSTLKMFSSGNFKGFNKPDPIELTEEILSKIKGSITRVNPLETEIDLGLLYWFSSVPKSVFIATNGFKDIEISCEFLHQLQNLYFALTGEELEIKL